MDPSKLNQHYMRAESVVGGRQRKWARIVEEVAEEGRGISMRIRRIMLMRKRKWRRRRSKSQYDRGNPVVGESGWFH